ncbi:hypothetical protein ABK040_004757 [Willaertia magna]
MFASVQDSRDMQKPSKKFSFFGGMSEDELVKQEVQKSKSEIKPVDHKAFTQFSNIQSLSEISPTSFILKLKVNSCENLTIGDIMTQSSDPYVELRLFKAFPSNKINNDDNDSNKNSSSSGAFISDCSSTDLKNDSLISPRSGRMNRLQHEDHEGSSLSNEVQESFRVDTIFKNNNKDAPEIKRIDSIFTKDYQTGKKKSKEQVDNSNNLYNSYTFQQIGKEVRTSTIMKTLNPKWDSENEIIRFFIDRETIDKILNERHKDKANDKMKLFLRLDVYDFDKYSSDDWLGFTIIDIEEEGIFDVLNKPSQVIKLNKTLQGVKKGTIQMEMTMTEDSRLFGISLKDVLKRKREEKSNGVPYLVTTVMDYIVKEGPAIVGIFRISGNATVIEQIKRDFDDFPFEFENFNLFETYQSKAGSEFIHVAVGILKNYLKLMPEPIFSFELVAEYFKNNNKNFEAMRDVIKQVQREYLPLLSSVLKLCKAIISNQNENKMTPVNMGIVFGPNLTEIELCLQNPSIIRIFMEDLLTHSDDALGLIEDILLNPESSDDEGEIEVLTSKTKSVDITTPTI